MTRLRISDPSLLVRIGAACLLLASVGRWFVQPSSHLWRGVADGAWGALMGAFIGCALMALRLKARRADAAG
jgi:hypothetical protein